MNTTHVVMILDESASMKDKLNEVFSGFNNFILNQKNLKNDNDLFYLIKFNNCVNSVYKAKKFENVEELNLFNYKPNGFTALYDAVYFGITSINESINDRVICVIITDGEENSSKCASLQMIKNLIKDKEAKGNWNFLYIGEKPDVWARETGMDVCDSVPYDHDSPLNSFKHSCDVVTNLRTSHSN